MTTRPVALLLAFAMLLTPSLALAFTPATVTTFSGTGLAGHDNGISTAASFRSPTHAVVDSEGTAYVADTGNHLIRKATRTGAVTTPAGHITGRAHYGQPVGGNIDGPFSAATFNEPRGLALADDGTLYVADSGNGAIRVLATDGTVSTLATGLDFPTGIALTADGDLLVSETLQHRIVKVTPDGTVDVVVGGGYIERDGAMMGGYKDGIGLEAQFNEPAGLALSADGTLYIADAANQRIRTMSPDGHVSTLAGSGDETVPETGYIVGGFKDGPGLQAQFNYPQGVTVAADGTVYVADSHNHRIRRISRRCRHGGGIGQFHPPP